MKKHAIQFGLILLFLVVAAGTVYLAPLILKMFPNGSYRFVFFFLIVILSSNILAKIAYKYFEL